MTAERHCFNDASERLESTTDNDFLMKDLPTVERLVLSITINVSDFNYNMKTRMN